MLERQWTDWKWQLSHTIRDIGMFEKLLDVRFEAAERYALEKTLDQFPLSITPYYLSLIDKSDYKNDPVFKQASPTPRSWTSSLMRWPTLLRRTGTAPFRV